MSVGAAARESSQRSGIVHFQVELDRLAAHLAVFDIAGRAGREIDQGLKALAAIGTLNGLELRALRAACLGPGLSGLEYRFEAIARIDRIGLQGRSRLAGTLCSHASTLTNAALYRVRFFA